MVYMGIRDSDGISHSRVYIVITGVSEQEHAGGKHMRGNTGIANIQFRNRNTAASSVIAVIVMVATTVVLAAVLYSWSAVDCNHPKRAPRADATVSRIPEGFEIAIFSIYHEVAVTSVFLTLTDSEGRFLTS